jgi:hypothetical protein
MKSSGDAACGSDVQGVTIADGYRKRRCGAGIDVVGPSICREVGAVVSDMTGGGEGA